VAPGRHDVAGTVAATPHPVVTMRDSSAAPIRRTRRIRTDVVVRRSARQDLADLRQTVPGSCTIRLGSSSR